MICSMIFRVWDITYITTCCKLDGDPLRWEHLSRDHLLRVGLALLHRCVWAIPCTAFDLFSPPATFLDLAASLDLAPAAPPDPTPADPVQAPEPPPSPPHSAAPLSPAPHGHPICRSRGRRSTARRTTALYEVARPVLLYLVFHASLLFQMVLAGWDRRSLDKVPAWNLRPHDPVGQRVSGQLHGLLQANLNETWWSPQG
jgi:hypothetical protein